MPRKPRGMRTRLRSASKVQERSLQDTAQRLIDKPELAVPRCEGHRNHFGKDLKHVRKAFAARDDPEKLVKLSRRGPPIGVAYAATLSVGLSGAEDGGKLIMLQVKTPFGTVPIVSRGKAKATHLVALQNFDDRKLRMFGLLELVRKKKLHFYSLPDGGVLCTGRKPAPPRAFVQEEMAGLGLIQDPEGYGCNHAIHADERLVLNWRSAGIRLRRCGACTTGDRNSLHTIVQHMAAPKLLDDFEVHVDLAPLPTAGGQPVELPTRVEVDQGALERYRSGEVSDAGLLEAQRASRLDRLRDLDGPLFVHGGTNYGADVEAFLEALRPTQVEARALRAVLDGYPTPVVMEKGSGARVLADLWPDRGVEALTAVSGDPEVAREVYAAHDVTAKGVGPALQQAQARGSRAATESELPRYRDLPAGVRLADAVARAFRAHGRPAATAVLEGASPTEPKGVVHALELALGAGQSKQWKYQPTELDLATSLAPHATALLEGPAKAYDDALRALAKGMGLAEELRRV